jgi:hypothetical protein
VKMLTKAYQKFIQRRRVYCEHNPACLCYGQHLFVHADGSIILLCDRHYPKVITNAKTTQSGK